MVSSYLNWLALEGRDNQDKTARLRAVKAWCDKP